VPPVTITFLGTGNFEAPGRYWNSFVVQSPELTLLVEPSPTALPNLRRAGFAIEQLDAVVISHFHPDHTFGWPFLVFEAMNRGRTRPLSVVGPPGVEEFLASMMRLGAVEEVSARAHERLSIDYLTPEPGTPLQLLGGAHLTAHVVEHVARLTCFGYVIEVEEHRLGYSGDTHPCEGLETIAGSSETLVLECNGAHPSPTHMDVEAVRSLASRYPETRFIVTHRGGDVEPGMLPGILVPDDYDRIEVGAPRG
jgi:ribonuclease Z